MASMFPMVIALGRRAGPEGPASCSARRTLALRTSHVAPRTSSPSVHHEAHEAHEEEPSDFFMALQEGGGLQVRRRAGPEGPASCSARRTLALRTSHVAPRTSSPSVHHEAHEAQKKVVGVLKRGARGGQRGLIWLICPRKPPCSLSPPCDLTPPAGGRTFRSAVAPGLKARPPAPHIALRTSHSAPRTSHPAPRTSSQAITMKFVKHMKKSRMTSSWPRRRADLQVRRRAGPEGPASCSARRTSHPRTPHPAHRTRHPARRPKRSP